LVEEYVKTGKVKFEYRDYAFLGDESKRAAEAASCAADQGQYWRYHDTIYLNQVGENQGAFSDRRLKQMAERIGLDMDEFNGCFDGGTYKDKIEATAADAQANGITSTPSVLVNGTKLDSFQYDALKAAIEAELAT
jgi:protein-disulfide isomerase